MHRDMPEDIMKNVRLGNVFERIVATQPSGCRELARGKHFKKRFPWQKTADRCCAPPGSGPYSIADRAKIRQPIILQSNDFVSFEVLLAGVGIDLGTPPAHQLSPH